MRSCMGVLGILLACPLAANAQGMLDRLSDAVVLLQGDCPETVAEDGAILEVGVREMWSKEFRVRANPCIGTGFLVVQNDRLVMFTAAHVAKGLTPDSAAIVKRDGHEAVKVTLGDLTGWHYELHWEGLRPHDAAAVALRPTAALEKLVRTNAVPASAMEGPSPSRDIDLVVLGFPMGLGLQGGSFSPVSRETRLAAGPLDFGSGVTLLLLQDPSIGGYSGAPVFDLRKPVTEPGGGIVFRERELRCVGLVSGTISDVTGGKLAAVVPSSVLLGILQRLWGEG